MYILYRAFHCKNCGSTWEGGKEPIWQECPHCETDTLGTLCQKFFKKEYETATPCPQCGYTLTATSRDTVSCICGFEWQGCPFVQEREEK